MPGDKVKKTSGPKKTTSGPKKTTSGPKKTTAKTTAKTAPKKVSKVAAKPKVTKAPIVEKPAVAAKPKVTKAPIVAPISTTPEDFKSLIADLTTSINHMKELRTRVVKLDKQVQKELREANKKIRKKRVVDPNAEPSGFAKPGPVSDELRKFLGLGKDELIARTAVTQKINAYCKDNNLQIPSDKRRIKPDAPLRKLLKMGPKDELTFFNLQKYMKLHFPNKEGVYPVA